MPTFSWICCLALAVGMVCPNIRFWKTRIEETEGHQTFDVGLIYGPSGCGKSSLVKAGLLPHLSRAIVAIAIEATPDETETRILADYASGCRSCRMSWDWSKRSRCCGGGVALATDAKS